MQIECINKLKKSKIVEIFSSYEKVNYYILRYIFQTKMVDIGKMSVKYRLIHNGIEAEYFDEEISEQKSHIVLNKEEMQGFTKKENKKIKIFL